MKKTKEVSGAVSELMVCKGVCARVIPVACSLSTFYDVSGSFLLYVLAAAPRREDTGSMYVESVLFGFLGGIRDFCAREHVKQSCVKE